MHIAKYLHKFNSKIQIQNLFTQNIFFTTQSKHALIMAFVQNNIKKLIAFESNYKSTDHKKNQQLT